MKKRIVALAMAGLMVLSAVGCGPNVSKGGSEGKRAGNNFGKRKRIPKVTGRSCIAGCRYE